MFQRFFDEGLAQASFLIGCDRTRRAVVVDPRRDAAIYLEAARRAGVEIAAAIETHVHADFLSGARELAAAGAAVLAGPGADLGYAHRQVDDGEELVLGDVVLTFLHTPGHTFEHVAVGVRAPGEAARLLTGDLLFVGAVGRPDLVGLAETRQLAAQLFESLARVMRMDPATEVHPGHGAGSLCGAGIGHAPSTTIGREADQNPLLRHADREAFVAAVIADLPETPPYFARMKRLNQQGPPLLSSLPGGSDLPAIRPAAAAALAADGAVVVDLRPADAFAEAHPDGALHLAYGSKVGYWAGWVLRPETPLLLVADDAARAREAASQLRRVGLDRLEGMIDGGFDAWKAASLPTAALPRISARDLHAAQPAAGIVVVDVRTASEWQAGHVPGSINIPVGQIPSRIREIPAGAVVATLCEGGYRSSLAASLLAQEGVPDVVNVAGGMAAYRGLPQETR